MYSCPRKRWPCGRKKPSFSTPLPWHKNIARASSHALLFPSASSPCSQPLPPTTPTPRSFHLSTSAHRLPPPTMTLTIRDGTLRMSGKPILRMVRVVCMAARYARIHETCQFILLCSVPIFLHWCAKPKHTDPAPRQMSPTAGTYSTRSESRGACAGGDFADGSSVCFQIRIGIARRPCNVGVAVVTP